jgi:hypothetical protein
MGIDRKKFIFKLATVNYGSEHDLKIRILTPDYSNSSDSTFKVEDHIDQQNNKIKIQYLDVGLNLQTAFPS